LNSERSKPNRGLLIIFSGPSGAGKGTILTQLLDGENKLDSLRYSVSATTRPPRPGEVDGENYFFITRQVFEEKINSGGMLEWAEYCGNYYGTPADTVEQWRQAGKDVVLEIEVMGARQVMEAVPDAVSIFILPPSLEELERRLSGRGTEPPDMVAGRLAVAKEEMKQANNYGYVVVNDDFLESSQKVRAIFIAEKCKSTYMKNEIDEVIKGC